MARFFPLLPGVSVGGLSEVGTVTPFMALTATLVTQLTGSSIGVNRLS